MDQEPILEHFHKQPSESFYVCADMVDMLATGEEIVLGTSTVTAKDTAGEDATSDVLDSGSKRLQDNTKLSIRVRNGTEALSPYKLTYKAVTDLGNILEVDVELRIKEI